MNRLHVPLGRWRNEQRQPALHRAGADTGLEDRFGATALDMAVTLGREAIAGLLRQGTVTN